MAELDAKYVAGYYNNQAKIGVGHMTYMDTVFVEGSSDADFFKKVIGSRYSWSGLNGKENVIEVRNDYINNRFPTNGINCYFCIDRDYDEILGATLQQDAEKALYYQMCLQGRTGGYNDLECFLFMSPIFDYTLKSKYGVKSEDVATIREEILTFAAWMGSYRVANRIWQAKCGKSEFCCNLDPNDTIVDEKEYGRHEVNPAFLFQENLAKIKKGRFVVDWSKFERKMESLIKSNYSYEFVVDEAHKIQDTLKSADKETLINYCRGHDITYLTCAMLRNYSSNFRNLNRHDVEDAMENWPLSSEGVTARSKEYMEQFQMIKELMV
ncbi:MAG: DUF4435 domain-containing protein [Fibrobacter sp.]|nr:DUF4435 domain-containing protein [Fibrobacter sp.]